MSNLFHNDAMGKFILRMTVGLFMLFHGVAKIIHPGSLEFIGNSLSSMGLPSAIAYGVYVGEIIAPLMVILGFHC
ncbi:MAG: DoxX family protein, partial [Gammaproteobacteria bacterium]|nr:DoxX family protein [Gammaproteobacteria bacterium]MDX2487349.1 DoxX family protein [Gammaproteobacteria bacterium]